jgi:hypothetical protein
MDGVMFCGSDGALPPRPSALAARIIGLPSAAPTALPERV